MVSPSTRLARVCQELNTDRAKYILVGAAALQLRGTTRATRDIDMLIAPTLANACRVLAALSRLGFGFASELSPEEIVRRPVTIIGDMPKLRRASPRRHRSR